MNGRLIDATTPKDAKAGITDKNLDKDGNYVKIFEVKNNRIIQNKSSFESTTDKGKFLICFF